MADPKYANLPGIAHDEPDVYETSDLPESEQTSDFYEDESDPVERIHLSAGEAYQTFKGKSVNAQKVDFSSRISKHLRTGYDVWELAGTGVKETPLQKYQRLQCEMKELLEEVRSFSKSQAKEEEISVTEQHVEDALKKLNQLRLEETLGMELISNITDPEGSQIQKLLSQIEAFKQNASDKPESQTQSDADSIVYHFNYRPEQARIQQTARLAELETRLHRLENILGASDEKLARLSAPNKKGSLLETAENLCATASLLDSAQLDHIEGRLTALSQHLEGVVEKKEKAQADPEKDKMIEELYSLAKASESIGALLPQTVERLAALETLHNKASDFSQTLAQVEAVQAEVKSNVENNKALLQGVQQSFAINLDEINKTVLSLDARIKALKKK